MTKLTPSNDHPFPTDALEIAVVGENILVSCALFEALRVLNAANGEGLYSLLAEYPQALQGADRFPTHDALKAHAKKVMETLAPLLPPEMSQPLEREDFRFGAVIPDTNTPGYD